MIETICGADIDWSSTGDMLAGFGAIAGAAAVAYAAWVGSNTFDSWRRQKSEGRRIDLAEETLAAVYRAQEALAEIRLPKASISERVAAGKMIEENGFVERLRDPDRQEMVLTAQLHLTRVTTHQAAFDALAQLRPSAKAIFGDVAGKIMKIQEARSKVRYAAESYARMAGTGAISSPQDVHNIRVIQELIWADPDQAGNALFDEIAGAVAAIENILLPIIRSDLPPAEGR